MVYTVTITQTNYDATIDKNEYTVTINSGAVAGAGAGISNVVEDLTPQLGGFLDINGKPFRITAAGTLDVYDSTGVTLLMRLHANGDLGIKGGVYQL